ncbi:hypothetical protein [Saccharothrix sp. ALI-22-I]|uniref:hypothetical protein n=1 Tax=Saccharothrix sp. ALI-22-I TaxID=1933778 RepID=UPI0015C34D30|nr:hypothetical protein [Saccharothrix sp. ALI-22-I]
MVTWSMLAGDATVIDPHDVREYPAPFGGLERFAVRGDELEDLLERISGDHRTCG